MKFALPKKKLLITRKSSRKLCVEQTSQSQRYVKKSYFIGMTASKCSSIKKDQPKESSMEIDATPEAGIQAITFICKLKSKVEKEKLDNILVEEEEEKEAKS